MTDELKNGDYVLATKWSDGDPRDQWCVGFFDRNLENGRFLVVDDKGSQFRLNGFRRVEKISSKRGEFILKNMDNVSTGSRSLWWWKRVSMKNIYRGLS